MKKWVALLALPLAAFAYTANDGAKTILTDGTQSDTQAAVTYVDGKNEDGWVMTIGAAGSPYTWTTAVNMAATFVHSFTIQGAGTGVNRPTITGTGSGQCLGLRATPGKLTKVQYIKWDGTGGSFTDGFIAIDPTSTSDSSNAFWIENCDFNACGSFAIKVLTENRVNSGMVYGLIDLCAFTISSGANGIYVYGAENGNGWLGSMTWGTVNTVTVEDCTFTKTGVTVEGNPAIDSAYFGARWLARYNTFTNWVLVAHGADSAPTSTLQVEVLHNTFVQDQNDGVDFIMYLRGGTMRFWGNTVTLSGGATLNNIVKTAIDPCCGNAADFQQIGHGATAGVESVHPVYVWGNTLPGGVTVVGEPTNNPDLWTVNVEYFLSDPGNYTELAYPHPLRGGGGTGGSTISGQVTISGKASIQ